MPLARRRMPSVLPPPPTGKTLAKYGLTIRDWYVMCLRQRCVCPVCNGPFGDRKLVVDHAHVAGFRASKKRKSRDKQNRSRTGIVRVRAMTPAERRVHVRGVLHAWCNGLVRRWLTEEKARSILKYLEAHRARREAASRAG